MYRGSSRIPLAWHDHLVIVADRARDMLPSGAVSLSTLVDLPLILPMRDCGSRDLLEQALRNERLRIQPVYEATSKPLIVQFLADLPMFAVTSAALVAEEVATGRLVAWDVTSSRLEIRGSILYSADRSLSTVERTLVALLKAELSECGAKPL